MNALDLQGENDLNNSETSNKEVIIESVDGVHNCDVKISNLQKSGENCFDTSTHLIFEEQNIIEDTKTFKNETTNLEGLCTTSRTDCQVNDAEAKKQEQESQRPDDCQPSTNSVEVNIHKHMNLSAIKEPPPELIIVSREEWRAIPPRRVSPKPHLAAVVVLTYATSSKACFTPHTCERVVRKLQRHHMRGGLPDIPYNFMVGGDGRVYEGRGWFANSRTLVQLTHLRGHLIEIAFIGDYKVERPSDAMFDAALELVQYGQENLWIEDKFGLYENYEGLEIKPVNVDD